MKDTADEPETITVDNLDEAIERHINELGYRLDMIVPADSPTAALLSKNGETLRLIRNEMKKPAREQGRNSNVESNALANARASAPPAWVLGRAGMMYRDLIPGRLDAKLIASHIRLTEGGEVPDYVHYHKVRFQMIYCVRGVIKVVYEDQGEPFWLRPGDCVLQPPEIRHRVLWAEAGSEVVELGMPTVHETWVEHEITLPTADVKPDRVFNGQRFVRHVAADHANESVRDTGISAATDGFAEVKVFRAENEASFPANYLDEREIVFCFVLSGQVKSLSAEGTGSTFSNGDAFLLNNYREFTLQCTPAAEILVAAI